MKEFVDSIILAWNSDKQQAVCVVLKVQSEAAVSDMIKSNYLYHRNFSNYIDRQKAAEVCIAVNWDCLGSFM